MRIVIAGGHGKIALRLERLLADAGHGRGGGSAGQVSVAGGPWGSRRSGGAGRAQPRRLERSAMQHIDPATSARDIEDWFRPGMLPLQHNAAPRPTVVRKRVV